MGYTADDAIFRPFTPAAQGTAQLCCLCAQTRTWETFDTVQNLYVCSVCVANLKVSGGNPETVTPSLSSTAPSNAEIRALTLDAIEPV